MTDWKLHWHLDGWVFEFVAPNPQETALHWWPHLSISKTAEASFRQSANSFEVFFAM